MTWNEFKNYIENEFKKRGISKNTKIEYIDFSHPCFDHESCKPHVYFDEKENNIAIY